jgi:hypothetical protein
MTNKELIDLINTDKEKVIGGIYTSVEPSFIEDIIKKGLTKSQLKFLYGEIGWDEIEKEGLLLLLPYFPEEKGEIFEYIIEKKFSFDEVEELLKLFPEKRETIFNKILSEGGNSNIVTLIGLYPDKKNELFKEINFSNLYDDYLPTIIAGFPDKKDEIFKEMIEKNKYVYSIALLDNYFPNKTNEIIDKVISRLGGYELLYEMDLLTKLLKKFNNKNDAAFNEFVEKTNWQRLSIDKFNQLVELFPEKKDVFSQKSKLLILKIKDYKEMVKKFPENKEWFLHKIYGDKVPDLKQQVRDIWDEENKEYYTISGHKKGAASPVISKNISYPYIQLIDTELQKLGAK